MTNKTTELREKIFNISLTPINDIYYVPPGTDGSVGLNKDKIDQIIQLIEKTVLDVIGEGGPTGVYFTGSQIRASQRSYLDRILRGDK